jgi:hypothetical protein
VGGAGGGAPRTISQLSPLRLPSAFTKRFASGEYQRKTCPNCWPLPPNPAATVSIFWLMRSVLKVPPAVARSSDRSTCQVTLIAPVKPSSGRGGAERQRARPTPHLPTSRGQLNFGGESMSSSVRPSRTTFVMPRSFVRWNSLSAPAEKT